MAHEELRREGTIEGSSDRSFGWVFAVVFALIGAWPLLSSQPPTLWAFGVAGGLALIAMFRPSLLARPNRYWLKLGVLLGNVVSPIAIGILFYGVVTPISLVMRLVGKDPMRLKFERSANSYWIRRDPPGPPPDSFTNQF